VNANTNNNSGETNRTKQTKALREIDQSRLFIFKREFLKVSVDLHMIKRQFLKVSLQTALSAEACQPEGQCLEQQLEETFSVRSVPGLCDSLYLAVVKLTTVQVTKLSL
jgi:hypothetical protein